MEQTRHIQEGRSDAYLILQDAQHATEQVQPGQEAPDVDAYIIRNNASDLIAAHPDRDPRNHVVAQNTPYSEMAFTSSARHLTEQPGPYRNDFQRLYDRTMQTHKMGVSPGDDIGRSYVNQINHTIEDVLFEGLFLSQPDVLEAQNQRPFHELLSDHFTSTIVNEESTLLFHPQITPCDLRNVETYSYIPSDQFELANVLSDQVEKFLRFNQIVDPLTAQIEGLILSERSTNAGNRDAINETTTQALSQIRSQLFLLVFLPMFNLQTWKLINDDDPETEGVQNTKVKTFEDIRKTLILFKGLLSDEEMQKAEDIIDALELEWLNPAYHNVSNDLIRNSRRARFCTNAIDKWHDFSKELSEKPNTEATFANLKDTMESVRKDLITKLGKFVEAAGIYMPENEPLNQELHWQPNYHYKEGYEQRIHAAVFGTVDEYDTLYLVSIHRDERPQRDVHGHIIQDSSSRIEMDLSIPQPNDLISPPDHVAPYLGELQEALSYLSEMNTHIAKEYKDRVIEQLFANKEAKEEESNTLLVGATETTNPQYLIKPPSRERLSGLLAEQHRQLTTYRLGNQIGEIACFTDSTWLDFEKALYSLDASKASDTANDPYYNGMEGLYVDWYPENFFNLRTFILCYLTGWQKNGEPLELARGITEFYFRLLNDIYKPLSYHVTGLSLDGAEIQANQTWKEWMITFHNIFS
ncbi:hypothetical protein KKF63_08540 [bacterium]|nr:hypothetical protein [bacterium]